VARAGDVRFLGRVRWGPLTLELTVFRAFVDANAEGIPKYLGVFGPLARRGSRVFSMKLLPVLSSAPPLREISANG
jgi:hypothetical protein